MVYVIDKNQDLHIFNNVSDYNLFKIDRSDMNLKVIRNVMLYKCINACEEKLVKNNEYKR